MGAEEQAQWVTEFSEMIDRHEAMITAVAKNRQAITADDARAIQRVFALLAAWPFARDFCEKARKYGDYSARTYRLPLYIGKVREALAEGLTISTVEGRRVVEVAPGVPLRRRGRPTKEEAAARLRGEALVVQGGDDADARRKKAIARLLGMEVVLSGDAPREKNNAELKAEREAREAERARREPGLFDAASDSSRDNEGGGRNNNNGGVVDISKSRNNDISLKEGGASPCAQLMSDAYELRMAQDKLHLDQLAWMLSKPLQEKVMMVQALRVTSESASERAKLLGDQGAAPEAIEPYAQQAKEATEAYLAIYQDVDEELAVLHKRLYLDMPFVERFKARFKGVDIEKIQYITRPYYEKVRKADAGIDLRVKAAIEQESPEYAAKMKKEQEEKEEVAALVRYITRKDKGPSDERCKTMAVRIERLRELRGDAFADAYLPILEKTREENAKMNAAAEPPVGGGTTDHPNSGKAAKPRGTEPEGAKPGTRKATKKRTNKTKKQ